MDGILHLPTELQIQILRTCSLHDALQLSSTCHAMRSLFRHPKLITSSILCHTTPCYEDIETIVNEMLKIAKDQETHHREFSPGVHFEDKEATFTCPEDFTLVRQRIRLIKQGDIAAHAVSRQYSTRGRPNNNYCQLGHCYQLQPSYSTTAEHCCLVHIFFLFRLCVLSCFLPSLHARCHRTVHSLPQFDWWLACITSSDLFSGSILVESEARALYKVRGGRD